MIAITPEIQPYADRRQVLLARLRAKPDAHDWCEQHTSLTDELVRATTERVLQQHPLAPPISVIATGGYGRRELAPYSDVDLTVVPLEDAAVGLDEAIKDLYRALHSAINGALKLEVGYAYRLINDAPGLDEKSRTALVDGRLVAGSDEPLDALMDLFWETFPVGEFLIAKLEEREQAFAKFNDTPLVVEPHLKEGAGGLRCFQSANWIRVAIGERPLRRMRAYNQMLQLRNLLHLVSEKKQDVLTRPKQGEIAELVQRDLYALMSDCAENGVVLHHQFELARERIHEARFALGGGVLAIRGEARILAKASASSASWGVAKATQLGLRVPEREASPSGEIDGAEALLAISAGEQALRSLDRSGLLDVLLPELTRCRTLMPMDSAHTFTVFEHTFRAVRNLERFDPNSFLGELKSSLRDLGPLWLALLMHDVGKAIPERPHSESGAELVVHLANRWRLAPTTAQLVEWLVREHLSMARFTQMRDVHNPATVADFAEIVQDSERLTMLTLLTAADIQAVSRELWTPAQEAFLRELYARTMKLLEGESTEDDAASYRKKLLRAITKQQVDESKVERFLERMPAHYLTSTPPDLVRLHLDYVRQAVTGKAVTELHHDSALRTTQLTVCCLDRPGLLSSILGVIYAFDLSIHNIRASTYEGEKSVALDVFDVSFGSRPLPAATASQLVRALEDVLSGKRTADELLSERGNDANRVQQTFSYSYHEGLPAILEVQAPRGRGMAFRMSRFISKHGWNITAARVGQWAGRGAAAFYLIGADGSAIPKSEVEQAFRASDKSEGPDETLKQV